jgi:hypothetical protein
MGTPLRQALAHFQRHHDDQFSRSRIISFVFCEQLKWRSVQIRICDPHAPRAEQSIKWRLRLAHTVLIAMKREIYTRRPPTNVRCFAGNLLTQWLHHLSKSVS